MSSDVESRNKLTALFRSYEMNEKELLVEYSKIEKVYSQRKALYESLQASMKQFEMTLLEIRTSKRSSALMRGDVQKVSLLLEKEKELQQKLSEIEVEIEKAYSELNSADDRIKFSQGELMEVRLEKKRLEKLLENRDNFSRSISEASDEIRIEEMSYSRRNKGK